MEKIEILRIESLSRDPLVIEGYLFKGTNPKASKVAIVGCFVICFMAFQHAVLIRRPFRYWQIFANVCVIN